jgi:MFS transporter, FHS family, L-fucose permease
MAHTAPSTRMNTNHPSAPLTETKYILPFALVTSLFFLWSIGVHLNDVLVPHFKKVFDLTDFQSSFIQVAFFGGYFLAAFPAGRLMEKIGYKNGILTGLLICSAGTLLFLPAASSRQYAFFLFALFVMSSGQSFLEVGANPYVTVLGPPETAARRINFAQSFNAVGSTLVPVFGATFILSGVEYTAAQRAAMTPQQLQAYVASEANMVRVPYLVITAIFLSVAALIYLAHLPEVHAPDSSGVTAAPESVANNKNDRLVAHPHLIKGILAQFFYVGAQVGVASFIIRFAKFTVPDTLVRMANWGSQFLSSHQGPNATWVTHLVADSPEKMAAVFLVSHQFGFMIGRFFGSWMLKHVPAPRLLTIFGVGALICASIGIAFSGLPAVLAIVFVGFFNSIMFPTIFALSLKNLGPLTKRASSFIVMAIIGGALIPAIMGKISDLTNIQRAFFVPVICYVYVIYFAASGYRPSSSPAMSESAVPAEAQTS